MVHRYAHEDGREGKETDELEGSCFVEITNQDRSR